MASRQSGLGRGLGAILPDALEDAAASTRLERRAGDHGDAADGHAERDDLPRTSPSPTRASRSSTRRSTRSSRSTTSTTRPSCSRSRASGARSSAPAAGRSTPTTKRSSMRPPGLYTEPTLDEPDFDRSLVLSLCALALRLDVAALRRVARPAHRSLRPAQLRPPARDGRRARRCGTAGSSRSSCSTSTT